MDRRDFLRTAALLGIGVPLGGCSSDGGAETGVPKSGSRVVVVGAGAAGMSAAYLLDRAGVEVTMLEAAPTHGGRIKTVSDFVDFPIPLGGEWVHTDDGVLDRIVDDSAVDVGIELISYEQSDPVAFFDGRTLTGGTLGRYRDLKLVGATWLTFFERYVMPSVADRLKVDAPVAAIDYSGDRVAVTEASGTAHEADAVIVTVPIQVIKDRDIDFSPPLPADKLEAFDEAFVWGGLKMFIEFSETFYPAFVEVEGAYSRAGQKVWYDAAYGQRSGHHVLGLFTVGDQSEPYRAVAGDSPQDLALDVALAELDAMFDGAASRLYVGHVAQDWNAEPYVRQAYFADQADWRLPPRMREPVADRVFFAGDAYTDGENWSEVHVAAESARQAVDAMFDAGVFA